jgi:hypothetical protein
MNTRNRESICNLVTSCNIDDAVQLLLGWRKDLLNPIVEYDAEEEHNRYMSDEEDYEVSLEEILQSLWNSVSADYANAKFYPLHEEDVSKALSRLNDCELLIRQAHRYLCDIHDELAKNTYSRLRIDTLKTTNPSYPLITLTSLNQWALEQYNLGIFEEIGKPENQDSFQKLEQSSNEIQKSRNGLNPDEARNLRILFGLLFRAYETLTTSHGYNKKFATDQSIYLDIEKHLNQDPRCTNGFGRSSIAGFKFQNSDLGKIESFVHTNSTPKNRYLLVANTLNAFIEHNPRFQGNDGLLDVNQLATYLKSLAYDLPTLSEQMIEESIQQVIKINQSTNQ